MPPDVTESWDAFLQYYGIRHSAILDYLFTVCPEGAIDTPLDCVTCSTPPQEGKSTFIIYHIAWMLIRNPYLHIVYATYSQARANTISRQIRSVVAEHTPLRRGSSSVQHWETVQGGGLLAAGRGSSMTGYRSDYTIIDDPIKDMQEAQSRVIRDQIVSWYTSVVVTRMANCSRIIVIATRWHKDDLIAYVEDTQNATHSNIPAIADEDDPLGRKPGEYLTSVQGRTPEDWESIRGAVGWYVWGALYQGSPVNARESILPVQMIGVTPWRDVFTTSSDGHCRTISGALVIQSWDLNFGGADADDSDYVAGHVYAILGRKWILVDRYHYRASFSETTTAILRMLSKWPETSQILIEKAANGAAMIDTLRDRCGVVPVVPRGSKKTRALAVQPIIEAGLLSVVDTVYDASMMAEISDFPYCRHDDDVDALTQALTHTRTADYIMMRG